MREIIVDLVQQSSEDCILKFLPSLTDLQNNSILLEKEYIFTWNAADGTINDTGSNKIYLPTKPSGAITYQYRLPKKLGESLGFFNLSAGGSISLSSLIVAGTPPSDATLEYVDAQISEHLEEFDHGAFLTAEDFASQEEAIEGESADKLMSPATTPFSVRATLLSGISFVANSAISATDSVLTAFGKLQAQITKIKSFFVENGESLTVQANGNVQVRSVNGTVIISGEGGNIGFESQGYSPLIINADQINMAGGIEIGGSVGINGLYHLGQTYDNGLPTFENPYQNGQWGIHTDVDTGIRYFIFCIEDTIKAMPIQMPIALASYNPDKPSEIPSSLDDDFTSNTQGNYFTINGEGIQQAMIQKSLLGLAVSQNSMAGLIRDDFINFINFPLSVVIKTTFSREFNSVSEHLLSGILIKTNQGSGGAKSFVLFGRQGGSLKVVYFDKNFLVTDQFSPGYAGNGNIGDIPISMPVYLKLYFDSNTSFRAYYSFSGNNWQMFDADDNPINDWGSAIGIGIGSFSEFHGGQLHYFDWIRFYDGDVQIIGG